MNIYIYKPENRMCGRVTYKMVVSPYIESHIMAYYHEYCYITRNMIHKDELAIFLIDLFVNSGLKLQIVVFRSFLIFQTRGGVSS